MTSRYPLLTRLTQGTALLLIILTLFFPGLVEATEYGMAIGLILLLGIPHGATDHLIFQDLLPERSGSGQLIRFYAGYLLLMAGYGGLWYLAPTVGLLLFLLLSMYHFGQSNWNYVEGLPAAGSWGLNLTWGAFVVLGPVLLHYGESAPIIEAIIRGPAPFLAPAACQLAVTGLGAVNAVLPLGLWMSGRLNRRQLLDEWINLGLLGLIFYYTPVLLGFTVYFVGWHSLGSILDQVNFFRRRRGDYSVWIYARHTLPLTIVAIAGLFGLVAIQRELGYRPHIAQLFMFISVVTLPHMLLIDRLYDGGAGAKNDGLPTN